jgi:hypothetical protein
MDISLYTPGHTKYLVLWGAAAGGGGGVDREEDGDCGNVFLLHSLVQLADF